jgi:uncharacterized protein YkwD
VLHHRALVAYSAVLILLKSAVIIATIALPSSSLYSSSITEKNIVELTNAARTTLTLPTLSSNAQLSHAAQMKADDMMEKQYFAHKSPSGADALTWIDASGYRPTYVGENLAVHFFTSEDVQSGWLASPTHRANIVDPLYSDIGVGIAHGVFDGADSIIVVQMFGSPADQGHDERRVAAVPLPPTAATGTAIDEASVKITKQPGGYRISLRAPLATSVQVDVGSSGATLQASSTSGTWTGDVAIDPRTINTNGDQLQATVLSGQGEATHIPLAMVAPLANVTQVYQFADHQNKTLTLFRWIRLDALDDAVRQTYLYFIVFLVTVLLLNVCIKVRIQRTSVIMHALGVIGLAILLWTV